MTEPMRTMGRQAWADVRDERTARMALACVSEPGDKGLGELVAEDGAEAVWRSLWEGRRESRWGRRLGVVRLREVLSVMHQRRIRFIMPGDAEWPGQLDDLSHAEHVGVKARPLGLWAAGPGHLAEWADGSLAIVGTRISTPYGETIAADLAADVAARGVTVVSGGAYGIDVCAHRGALSARGRTIAVLASGLDAPYPRGNARVFEEIRAQGILLSELPPGDRPSRPRFLSRNRVIAALATGALMVEAKIRSGAQNTLRWADKLSRHRMAVPGPVTSAQSEGPHQELRDGATLVSSAAEVLEIIAPMGQETLPFPHGPSRVVDQLEAIQVDVFEAVPGSGGLLPEQIAEKCGRDLRTTLAVLGELEQIGLAEEDVRGRWRLRSGAVG